jgi:hypothetical protein
MGFWETQQLLQAQGTQAFRQQEPWVLLAGAQMTAAAGREEQSLWAV